MSGFDFIGTGVGKFDLVSTDVFDTLLLRTLRSERSREVRGEGAFSRLLATRGIVVPIRALVQARRAAQRLAFRALETLGRDGEIALTHVISRQLHLLGLPGDLVDDRIAIEIDVETSSLRPNSRLIEGLKAHKAAGARIVATSDTTLPGSALAGLIDRLCGPGVIDGVYASSDHGASKREGKLFGHVIRSERVEPGKVLHVGDDWTADVLSARKSGITACHLPRPSIRNRFRAANGMATAAGLALQPKAKTTIPRGEPTDATAFGRNVLGPITAQFCQYLWLYAAQAEASEKTIILFCARGGIGIREAFERAISKLGLPLAARRENFLISRLVAARSALVAGSVTAIEEIEREFKGLSFVDVAQALGGRTYALPDEWHQPFNGEQFLDLLHAPSGAQLLADIRDQDRLFRRHFDAVVGDAYRIILCDTGLYGSTQKLLAAAMPERRLESVLFARSNYKGLSQDHFAKVTGLMLERNRYTLLDARSSVLRYWHLIEALFEPDIASVRLFSETGSGEIVGNCGRVEYGAVEPARGNALLTGALAYIDGLSVRGALAVTSDAAMAWCSLRKAITFPSRGLGLILGSGERSVDFGRSGALELSAGTRGQSLSARLATLKVQPWREGAIARDFPMLKHIMLPALGGLHALRSLTGRGSRR